MTDPSAIRKLIEGVTEADGCFEAALVEGWIDALANGDIERIRDIWNRRISMARVPLVGILAEGPQLLDEVERLTKSRNEWIRDFDTCAKVKERALTRIAELEAGMGERK